MTPDENTSKHGAAATVQRHQEHFVADLSETPVQATDRVKEDKAPLSLWGEAWKNLRRQPLFLISAVLILVVAAVSLFPGLFSAIDPTSEACQLANSDAGPAAGHPLGFTQQGCDVYAGAPPARDVGREAGHSATKGGERGVRCGQELITGHDERSCCDPAHIARYAQPIGTSAQLLLSVVKI